MSESGEPALSHRPVGEVAVPEVVRDVAGNDPVEAVWLNQLGGLTFAIGDGPSKRFLKWAAHESGLDLKAERDRLAWANEYVAAPEVLDYGETDVEAWLITKALPGDNAVSDRWKREPARAVRAIGAQLRQVHDLLPVDRCPFDWMADTRLRAKRVLGHAGRLDPKGWRPEFRHLTAPAALLAAEQTPPVDRLVVCHGDACAPNTLVGDDGQPTGIVDLGAMGVADRWADIAVATWSTEWNYGPGWEAALLDAYGIEPDPERTAYYRLLWEIN